MTRGTAILQVLELGFECELSDSLRLVVVADQQGVIVTVPERTSCTALYEAAEKIVGR
jgi:hypothetical protein